MIRGIDFYRYCLDIIRKEPAFEIRFGEIQSIQTEGHEAVLYLGGERITADYIFNSILFEKPVLQKNEHYLLQHFRGWVIETAKPVFNPAEATLMDFRTGQEHGTTFVYVKPFSDREALVEYTLFTETLLEPAQYEDGLRDYIRRFLQVDDYTIREEENGIIPMTNHKFPAVNGRVINLGTAGGQTKASSGYTFRFIQKHSARITENLIKRGNPFIPLPTGPARFRFYDSTLLHVLRYNKVPGDKVFTLLFKKNKPQRVFRFLDNETSIAEELMIISSLPTIPFLKASMTPHPPKGGA